LLPTSFHAGKIFLENPLVGTVLINHVTGALTWDQENLDPVIKSYVKRYLFEEGFIEQALGMLDPALDPVTTALLEALMDSGFR
jgi:hypothetical protein